VLRRLAPDLWVAERPQRFLGIEMGTRMTVVRLADGSLSLHSPVALDDETRRELDALGPVRAVVAPNRFHHLHVGDYPAAYPEASIYAAPGLAEKRRDLTFHAVLGDDPAPVWAGRLEQLVFRGLPVFNEVVFFHPPSQTVVLTDLAFNVRRTPSLVSYLFFALDDAYGKFGPGRIERWLVRDRDAARVALERLLAWDFDRVVVAHGDILERDGREAVRASFAWLSRRN